MHTLFQMPSLTSICMYAVCIYKCVHCHKQTLLHPLTQRLTSPFDQDTQPPITSQLPRLQFYPRNVLRHPTPAIYISRGDEAWFINSLLSYNSFTTIMTEHTAIISSSFAMGTFKLHMLLSRGKPPHITPFRVLLFHVLMFNVFKTI